MAVRSQNNTTVSSGQNQRPLRIEFEKLRKEVQEVKELKKDFMTIFGLFASVVAFLAIEVKLFDETKDINKLIGISCFLLGGLILFSLSLRSVMLSDWKQAFLTYIHPAFLLTIALFLAAYFMLK